MPDEMNPQLPAETEAAVRRALADARVTEPMPADVAARLEATLRELSDERGAPDAVELAPRRRRRNRWTPALVAAAAVVAVGVGVGVGVNAIVQSTGSGGDTMTASDAGADNKMAPEAADQSAPRPSMQAQSPSPLTSLEEAGRRPALHSDRLRRDLKAVRDSREAYSLRLGDCPAMPPTGVPAILDDSIDVFIEFTAPTEGEQRVVVANCTDGTRVASVVLPAP